jgi:hypothetical protein
VTKDEQIEGLKQVENQLVVTANRQRQSTKRKKKKYADKTLRND